MSVAKEKVFFRTTAAPASGADERDFIACPEFYCNIEQWENDCNFVNVDCWFCGISCKDSVSRFPTSIPVDVKQIDSQVKYTMKGSFHSWSCMVNWIRQHYNDDASKLIRRAQQIYQAWGGNYDLQTKIGRIDPTQMRQMRGATGITKERFNEQLI